jgi:hypothetical protein
MFGPLTPSEKETPDLSRRQFLTTAACGALAALTAEQLGHTSLRAAETKADAISLRRKLKYVGWQVGVTYQATAPGGMTRDELMRLLDEMVAQRMNLLSLMMLSYRYFDANHDGYCWPVRNPKLKPVWDDKAINGQSKTEFVREVIQAAADRKIEVQLFMNWGIWNPERIRQGYPTAAAQVMQQEAVEKKEGKGWLHCPDSPGAWQAGLDEVADLLAFYDHPNIKSYCLERLSYGGAKYCYCPHTQERFRQDTGRSLLETDAKTIIAWKTVRIGGLLKAYAEHVRRVKPKTSLWLHTQGGLTWGHDPATLRTNGVVCLEPHTIQFAETEQDIHKKLRRLAPNPCVLHFCTRDQRPSNYKLWIKTPEILTQALGWVHTYPGDNLAGLLFFNFNGTSLGNRKAVYEQLKRFDYA